MPLAWTCRLHFSNLLHLNVYRCRSALSGYTVDDRKKHLMKHIGLKGLLIIALLGITSRGYANILVNDTWQDGTRTDPAAPVYAENNGVVGTDADNDGDIESAWFASTGGSLTVAAPGDLRAVTPGNSLTWLTYFTPESTKVNLGAGDTLKVTWVFTPSSVNAGNTSLQFPLAIVNTPVGGRLTKD